MILRIYAYDTQSLIRLIHTHIHTYTKIGIDKVSVVDRWWAEGAAELREILRKLKNYFNGLWKTLQKS